MSSVFFRVEDARAGARRRLPRMIFDYVDGAAGDERACARNTALLDGLRMQPRVLVNTENRVLSKIFLGRQWSLPFGIAPMGMCDLSWPGADSMLAEAAVEYNIPLGLSTMASTSIEAMRARAGEHVWFQLYVGQSEALAFDMVRRAEAVGYDTLMLTVDVPQPALRPREQRHGFQAPLEIGPRQFFDFATHPHWSLRTLLAGVPAIANNVGADGGKKFLRNESRGKFDWSFLDRLRTRWRGAFIVKGVLSAPDAVRLRDAGVDAVYVSNHGGRQLDSAPASIEALPTIRRAVGRDYPLLFDSGVRNGEAVVKALALGADFVLLGRPFLYAIGAAGHLGLVSMIDMLRNQIDTTLAQLGRSNIGDIDSSVIARAHEVERVDT